MIDPYSLKRAPAKTETRTFTEDVLGSEDNPLLVQIELTLRKNVDFARRLLISDKAREYIERYIDGEWITGEDGIDRQEVSTLLPVDGEIPPVSRTLCYTIASLEVLQVPKTDEEPVTFGQWTAFSVMTPLAMEDIQGWLNKLGSRPKNAESAKVAAVQEAKNGSGAEAAP
jgi:hypothetical protein